MQVAYLICGSTGAGKTTYSRKLALELGALVFSIDEWMATLYWMDSSKDQAFDWALERVRRCETQIWNVAKLVLAGGRPVIFDLGFSTKVQRQRFRNLVASIGYQSELHFLDISLDVRFRRVMQRNTTKSDTFEFEVDEDTFNWMESYFEPPDVDELIEAVVVNEDLSIECD